MTTLRSYIDDFLSQLTAAGVKKAVVAPGSRSTPIAILLHDLPGIQVHMALDERSAGFFALGLAKSSREPIVLLCTSGTAAANFFPAVVEASLSRLPLIVLTADRPRELRDVGAPQTIDQVHLYGHHVKWFQDLPTPGGVDLKAHAAQVAARAVHTALTMPQGPVHLNFPFREPLLPGTGSPASPIMGPYFPALQYPAPEGMRSALHWLEEAERPLIIIGPEAPFIGEATVQQFASRGVPILVDPIACDGRRYHALTGYDTFLRSHPALPRPDLVVRVGAPPTSKVLNQWCQESSLILLDWSLGFREPYAQKSLIVDGDPALSLRALAEDCPRFDPRWIEHLAQVEETTWAHTAARLSDSPANFEGRLYAHLNQLLGEKALPVLVASSMPIRDLDSFYRHGPLRFYANRGANGIDGLVSTALGIAQHHGDVLAILGDLAFFHDMNGLALAAAHRLNALFVIVNNAGGAIFSHLSQRTLPHETFETLFGTPHAIDFSGVHTLYGGTFRRVYDFTALREQFSTLLSLDGLRVLEWQVSSREDTVALHQSFYAGEGQ